MVEREGGVFEDSDDESEVYVLPDAQGRSYRGGPEHAQQPPQQYLQIVLPAPGPQRPPSMLTQLLDGDKPMGTGSVLLIGLFLFTWAAIS